MSPWAFLVWNCPVIDLTTVKPLPVNDSAHVVVGKVSSPGQFPYQAAIWTQQSYDSLAFCGGSILSSRIVVTAAHCVHDARKVGVIAGARLITQREASHQLRRVDKMILHEDFDSFSLLNDIALLHLAVPLVLNARVRSIALPTSPETSPKTATVFLSGWGQNATHSNRITSTLLYVKSHVISNTHCQSRFYLREIIRNTHICVAGRWARGPCQGDSGAPLVGVSRSNKPVLLGLTSFGMKAKCQVSWPSVFTRITTYREWIYEASSQLLA